MTDRIIIADDHPLFRDGLRRIVQRTLGGQIMEVGTAAALRQAAGQKPAPSLMLLDLVFPGFDGAQTVAELRREFPATALIVISMTDDKSIADEVMAAGANGYISKSVTTEQMARSIAAVMQGDLVLTLESAADQENTPPPAIAALSPRLVEVLVHLGQGKTNKEIARDLDISPFTVRAHISALFKSLGVSTRAAAAAVAVANDLL
ncbi:response regulator transcription factor [Rhodovibrionaceae bacterium A322]